jgi:dienelactone hydrolase
MSAGRLAPVWLAVALTACATGMPGPRALIPTPPEDAALLAQLEAPPLDLGEVRVQPEGRTVEQNWFLDLYTLLHRRNYSSFRVLFDGADGHTVTGHLLLPPGPGSHPGMVVFPILAGSHVAAELLAKIVVRQGVAVVWLERRYLELETAQSIEAVVERMRLAVLDGRQMLDWLERHPRVDPERLLVGGISLGSMQAATLAAVDPRVRGALLLLTGGGLPETLYDSSEVPVRLFRDRMGTKLGASERDAFIARLRPITRVVDPLTWAHRIDPRRVYMVSGFFDRVLPPARSRALWEALGHPRWRRVPAGHYQAFPFMFSAASAGTRHLLRQLGGD